MRQLSPDELHQELFNIAYCFADICEKNGIPYFMLAGAVHAENQHEYTACQDINTNTWYFVPNMILEKCEATFETETDADAGHLS